MATALEQKQDLVISNCAKDSAGITKLVNRVKNEGYVVHLLGIYAEPEKIIERGVARELIDGKRYNRNIQKIKATFDNLGPAIGLINGSFKIVYNGDSQEPKIM